MDILNVHNVFGFFLFDAKLLFSAECANFAGDKLRPCRLHAAAAGRPGASGSLRPA
jgi:hypothetical protein